MSTCQTCLSTRIASVTGKTDDRCSVAINGVGLDGYVPLDMSIGGGDYLRFAYCLDCGQIQGKFPLGETSLEYLSETPGNE